MTRMTTLPVALLVSGLLAGCATDHRSMHPASTRPVPENARQLALDTADWSKAEKITLELRDYGLTPREIRLRVGQPYRLRIFNSGKNTHYFNAEEFFHGIAAHAVEIPNQAEIKADYFTQFEISRRGGELFFEFVPLRPGTYRAHCHLENHAELGVEVSLIIE